MSEHFVQPSSAADLAVDSGWIALDSEGLSQYGRKIQLIQFMAGESIGFLDPLDPTMDFEPFFEILRDSTIQKIVHGLEFEVPTLLQLGWELSDSLVRVKNIVDTQMAAGMAGIARYPRKLEDLVGEVLGKEITIDSMAQSDWSQCPLDSEQTMYALADVLFLSDLMADLRGQLEEKGFWEFYLKSMSQMTKGYYDLPLGVLRKNPKMNDFQKSIRKTVQLFSKAGAMDEE